MTADAPHVLILSTADWDRPIWTNKQHMAVQLANNGCEVTYVESMGLRQPTLSRDDLGRIVGRVRKITGRESTVDLREVKPRPLGVSVVTPKVIPIHRGHPVLDAVNRKLLMRSVANWLATPQDQRVLWAFSPVTYGLEDHAATAIYHCVDLLGEFPGVDAKAIDIGEQNLASKVSTAIASSRNVLGHLEAQGFTSPQLWENVADSELISAQAAQSIREPNTAVFIGNLTTSKVDQPLINQMLAANPELTLHIAGPIAEGGGESAAFDPLLQHPQVQYHGVLQPPQAARLMGRCAVGVVPYLVNNYTKGVFPMKVYEYLAAGLPVVCSGVPSVTQCQDVSVTDSATTFTSEVTRALRLAPSVTDVARRTQAASEHSWHGRGLQAMELLAQHSLSSGIGQLQLPR